MSGIVRQKEPQVTARPSPVVSEFDVASRGDEFHCDDLNWDGQKLEIDLSELNCDPLLVADLSLEFDRSMQSTVHV